MKLVKVTFSPAQDTVIRLKEVESSPVEMDDSGTEGLYEVPTVGSEDVKSNIQAVECSSIDDSDEDGLLEVYMTLEHIPNWVNDALETGRLKFAEL